MTVNNQQSMGLDRKEIDDNILDELHSGRNVPSNLAEELGVSRQYISQRLKLLKAADYVENVGRGVYELVDDPRTDTEHGGPSRVTDWGELESAIRQLEDAFERGDRGDVETAMERLRTVSGVDDE